MRYLYLSAFLGFTMVACQGVSTEKKNEDEAGSESNVSEDIEDKYQTALLSEEAAEKDDDAKEKDEKSKDKKKKSHGVADVIMGIFDADGDSKLSVSELKVLIKLTKTLVAKVALPEIVMPKHEMPKPLEKPDIKVVFKDRIFSCIDSNNDGALSQDEFFEAKNPMAMKKCFGDKQEEKRDPPDDDEIKD